MVCVVSQCICISLLSKCMKKQTKTCTFWKRSYLLWLSVLYFIDPIRQYFRTSLRLSFKTQNGWSVQWCVLSLKDVILTEEISENKNNAVYTIITKMPWHWEYNVLQGPGMLLFPCLFWEGVQGENTGSQSYGNQKQLIGLLWGQHGTDASREKKPFLGIGLQHTREQGQLKWCSIEILPMLKNSELYPGVSPQSTGNIDGFFVCSWLDDALSVVYICLSPIDSAPVNDGSMRRCKITLRILCYSFSHNSLAWGDGNI